MSEFGPRRRGAGVPNNVITGTLQLDKKMKITLGRTTLTAKSPHPRGGYIILVLHNHMQPAKVLVEVHDAV